MSEKSFKQRLIKKANKKVSRIEQSVSGDHLKQESEIPTELLRRSNFKHLRPIRYYDINKKKE